MSKILQKLKRKSLFQELQQKFLIETIQPFGKVVIVPSKAFKNEWKGKLENEECETFVSSYGMKSCFLVRRKKKHSEPSSVIEESPAQKVDKPSPVKENKPLTAQKKARVKELYLQGVSGKEIALKLGCKIQVIGGMVRHFKKPKEKQAETKSNSNDPDIVKELLSACSLLYPSHPQVCLFLLKEITVRMAVGLNE